jgi:predicted esterase
MNDYSAFGSSNNIPVLVIHDNNDVEVPVKAGIHIHNYLKTEHYF